MNKVAVKNMHAYLNELYFGNFLQEPKIKVFKEGSEHYMKWHGAFWPPNRIGLEETENWLVTLIHEMVHQYQYELDLDYMKHNKFFWAMNNKICEEMGVYRE